MNIIIKATNLELTPPIKEYIEEKIGSLSKFLQRFEGKDGLIANVEIARTSNHHHKGDVYRAEVNLQLPNKLIRVSEEDSDVRVAIGKVKEVLQREIVQYKDLSGHTGGTMSKIGRAGKSAIKKVIWWRSDKEQE
jgi:ribosomal subunit interface protein